jgi:glycerophosphoryl diester phosphodiesterase
MMQIKNTLIFIFCCLMIQAFGQNKPDPAYSLPEKGLCAHRGAMQTHPENTIPAFKAAIRAGAHMIEFDVWLTKDQEMVVIHDAKVDRTTDGQGRVSDLNFAEIRKLDAGSWKAPEFKGEQIPTLEEVLDVMPYNIWLNIHIKGTGELPVRVARVVAEKGRLHQAFLACSVAAALKAKEAVPGIMICNMERQESIRKYVDGTINAGTEFIQLRESKYPDFAKDVKLLKDNGIKVNYYGTDSPDEIKMLFETGVDFPLVNDIVHTIDVAWELDIQPVKPIFNHKN